MQLILNDVKKQKVLTDSSVPISPYNLFDGTSDFSGTSWTNLDQYTNDKLVSPFGNQSRQRKGAWWGLSQLKDLKVGQIYTISASVFVDTNSSSDKFIGVYGEDGKGNRISSNTKPLLYLKNLPADWITIKHTFTVPKNSTYEVRFESNSDQVNIHWADLMLNKGAVALDWNYSLNDLRSRLGGVKPSYRLYYAISLKEVA